MIHNIILAVYNDPKFCELISKMRPADLQEDLKHHIITELYRLEEKTPGKIEAIYNRGEMFGFLYGMVRLQFMSSKSTFHRLFRRQFDELTGVERVDDNMTEYEIAYLMANSELWIK